MFFFLHRWLKSQFFFWIKILVDDLTHALNAKRCVLFSFLVQTSNTFVSFRFCNDSSWTPHLFVFFWLFVYVVGCTYGALFFVASVFFVPHTLTSKPKPRYNFEHTRCMNQVIAKQNKYDSWPLKNMKKRIQHVWQLDYFRSDIITNLNSNECHHIKSIILIVWFDLYIQITTNKHRKTTKTTTTNLNRVSPGQSYTMIEILLLFLLIHNMWLCNVI